MNDWQSFLALGFYILLTLSFFAGILYIMYINLPPASRYGIDLETGEAKTPEYMAKKRRQKDFAKSFDPYDND